MEMKILKRSNIDRFFADLKPGDVFAYEEDFTHHEVAQIAAHEWVICEYNPNVNGGLGMTVIATRDGTPSYEGLQSMSDNQLLWLLQCATAEMGATLAEGGLLESQEEQFLEDLRNLMTKHHALFPLPEWAK